MSTRDSKPPIDWDAVHRRIEQLQQSIAGNWQPDPMHVRATLEQRARVLATPASNALAARTIFELIEFSLAHERYGIATAAVREVCPLAQLTPVPCTPAFVLGIINVRGEIISVIDLRKFFALPEAGLTDLNKVIILHSEKMVFGILADSIVEVRALETAEIQPATNITGVRAEYLLGVTSAGIAIINADKLLAEKNIVVDENVVLV